MLSAKYLLILLICLSGCSSLLYSPCQKINVCFTPQENCTEQIVKEIDRSKKSILIQEYIFTSKPIAKSLIRAKQRGIDIKVLIDETQINSEYSVINELFEEKIPIWIDFKPAIAHSKIIIIDEQKIITGSFNFTHSANFRNTENVLIIENNDKLIEKYLKNWHDRRSQSKLYTPSIEQ